MTLSNGAMQQTATYNSRLQPTSLTVNRISPASTLMDFTYGFDSDPGAGVVNNGNVVSIANNRDGNRSQSFTYDALNRIATAQTQATSGPHCWGETFSYDVWANLLVIGAITPTYNGCTQENLSVAATTKNQISGFSYDAAGNLLNDGSNSYTWDAESRLKGAAGVTYTYDGDGRLGTVIKFQGMLFVLDEDGIFRDALGRTLVQDSSGAIRIQGPMA